MFQKKLGTKKPEDIVSDADSIVSVVTRDIRGIAKAVKNNMGNLFESDDDQSIFLTQVNVLNSFETSWNLVVVNSRFYFLLADKSAHDELLSSQFVCHLMSVVRNQ